MIPSSQPHRKAIWSRCDHNLKDLPQHHQRTGVSLVLWGPGHTPTTPDGDPRNTEQQTTPSSRLSYLSVNVAKPGCDAMSRDLVCLDFDRLQYRNAPNAFHHYPELTSDTAGLGQRILTPSQIAPQRLSGAFVPNRSHHSHPADIALHCRFPCGSRPSHTKTSGQKNRPSAPASIGNDEAQNERARLGVASTACRASSHVHQIKH